jgi:hypothetical protein
MKVIAVDICGVLVVFKSKVVQVSVRMEIDLVTTRG